MKPFFFLNIETSEPEVGMIDIVLMHSRTLAWRHCILVKHGPKFKNTLHLWVLDAGWIWIPRSGQAWVWGAFSGRPMLRTVLRELRMLLTFLLVSLRDPNQGDWIQQTSGEHQLCIGYELALFHGLNRKTSKTGPLYLRTVLLDDIHTFYLNEN